MRILLALAAIGVGLIQAQPARTIPAPMMPLKMLDGSWHTSNGWVEFRFSPDNTRMTCRLSPEKGSRAWLDIMTFRLENGQVMMDDFRLVDSNGGLRFEDGGNPLSTMTYRKLTAEKLSYRFETGGKVTESGIMDRMAHLIPLTD